VTALEARLARLLSGGTVLASAVIAAGLLGGGTRAVTIGVALFILLPVARLLLLLWTFLRERDYRFGALAAFVIAVIALGVVLGARS
jgi:uncharacterized membrane protein